jgi:hypothetical protein
MRNRGSIFSDSFIRSITLATLIILICGTGCTLSSTGHGKTSTQQRRGDAVKSQETLHESPCGIRLIVTGSRFSPQVCSFQVITPGESCGPNTACSPQYVLSMTAGTRPFILEVILSNLKEFKRGRYRFIPQENLRDFNGYALDGNASVRNLSKGEIVLEPSATEKEVSEKATSVKVSFDVTFDGGINVRGSGEVPVKHISAP